MSQITLTIQRFVYPGIIMTEKEEIKNKPLIYSPKKIHQLETTSFQAISLFSEI